MTDKDRIREYNAEAEGIREDLDFLCGKFEEDGLRVPEGLSEDAVLGMLAEESAGPSHKQPAPTSTPKGTSARRRRLHIGIAAAACAALAIGLIPLLHSVLPASGAPGSSLLADGSGLVRFSSYDELDHEMKNLLSAQEQSGFYLDGSYTGGDVLTINEEADLADSGGAAADAPMAESKESSSDAAPAAGAAGSGSEPSHSDTYTQVEGIDEADIVKTDGSYIYFLSSAENQIIIAKAKKGKAERVGAVKANEEGYIHDLFIHRDQLIIISWDWQEGSSGLLNRREGVQTTTATIYDVSNHASPRKTGTYSQTGSYLSSRLMENRLCLVTNQMMGTYRHGKMLPQYSYSDGALRNIPLEDISSIPKVATPAFTVIGLLDLDSGSVSKDSIRTKAVLGCSDEIYCNGENLYVTASVPDSAGYVIGSDAKSDDEPFAMPTYYDRWETQILKFSLSEGEVRSRCSAAVDGSVNDQFSMDEKDGILRIATTSDAEGSDVNNLFLLDEDLKQLGACRGFARGEHIEAVRYIRNKAYVITYEQTDPLFIIDLSDPANPVIEGHVKISGFSTLLVPCDADHLLGLGFSTETTEFGEATNGVKLALFDISDPSAPAVADSREFPDMDSPVQYDHKALLVGPEADYYAIPYERNPVTWDDSEIIEEELSDVPGGTASGEAADADSQGILIFSAEAGKLEDARELETRVSVSRCIYIDSYLYGICEDDTIQGFRID